MAKSTKVLLLLIACSFNYNQTRLCVVLTFQKYRLTVCLQHLLKSPNQTNVTTILPTKSYKQQLLIIEKSRNVLVMNRKVFFHFQFSFLSFLVLYFLCYCKMPYKALLELPFPFSSNCWKYFWNIFVLLARLSLFLKWLASFL